MTKELLNITDRWVAWSGLYFEIMTPQFKNNVRRIRIESSVVTRIDTEF